MLDDLEKSGDSLINEELAAAKIKQLSNTGYSPTKNHAKNDSQESINALYPAHNDKTNFSIASNSNKINPEETMIFAP